MSTFRIITSILALVGIGFFAGFYTHREITTDKIKRVANTCKKRGFQDYLYTSIKADSLQIKEIGPIVDPFADDMSALIGDQRAQRMELLDSLHVSLKDHLEPWQDAGFERFTARFARKKSRTARNKDHD